MAETFLIWGGNGWIGSMVCDLLRKQGEKIILASSRLQDYCGITKELSEVNPDYVINLAGITGRPNIDWCESHKQDTFLINTVGAINLADACWRKNIHITNYASGCIYTYDDAHPIGTKFSELDTPNFKESTYSESKLISERILSDYDNVLTLRLRLPISADFSAKNLLTKLIGYKKVVNIPNSVSVLPELLPISIKMTKSRLKGIYNLTNPGAISHNELLTLYKTYINNDFTWVNFSLEEQDAILKAKRSNCELDTTKLQSFHEVTEVHKAIENLLISISKEKTL